LPITRLSVCCLAALQLLHHYRINHKGTPQLGRLLARIFAPVVLAPDDIDADFQTDVRFLAIPAPQMTVNFEMSAG